MATLTTLRTNVYNFPGDPSSYYRPNVPIETGTKPADGSFPPDGTTFPSLFFYGEGLTFEKTPGNLATAPIKFRNGWHDGTPGVGQRWFGGKITSSADRVNTLWEADVNEEHRFTTHGVTSGTFRLNLVGEQTGDIAYSSDEVVFENNVRNAIEALPSVDPGEITVSDDGNNAWSLRFGGRYARQPQTLTTVSNSTLVGGTINVTLEEVGTPPQFHWHSHYGAIFGIHNEIRVDNVWFDNCGDALDIGGAPTHPAALITGCKFTDIHDDAIQNDKNRSLWIQNCLIDGAMTFLSCQNSSDNGSAGTVIIANSMIRLKPFYQSYKPWKYGHNQHGGFFKSWTPATAPKLLIHNCIFRADQPNAYGGPSGGFGLSPPNPSGGVTINNCLLINTDSWPAGALADWQARGNGIRLGTTADWDYHVNRWNPRYTPDLDATL